MSERRKLAIFSSLKSQAFALVERQQYFRLSILCTTPTQTLRPQVAGSGEEAIALVKVRCRLRWRSPEQTCASCYFANVTNTFEVCKRNAVHTSASKEQTLTNIFGTVSLQAGKEKEVSSKALKLGSAPPNCRAGPNSRGWSAERSFRIFSQRNVVKGQNLD